MNRKNLPNFWTEEEDSILKESVNSDSFEISRILSENGFVRSAAAVRRRKQYLGIAIQHPSVEPIYLVEEMEPTECSVLPEFINSVTKGKITNARKKITEEVYNSLREIRDETKRTMSLKDIAINSNNESCVIVLSDWHIGKFMNYSDLHSYNLEIAVQRVREIPRLVLQAIKGHNVDEIILVLAGDMIDGEGIYPGQEINLQCAVIEQSKIVTRELWQLTKQFKELFPVVRIVTCRGNHGRTGQSTEANWDNIIYQQLELLTDMENNPGIAIKNMYGSYNTFEAKNWTGMVRHKAPAQADTPSAISKFSGWSDIHKWDFMIYGHYHHWGAMTWNNKPIFRNGCLAGGDDYAEEFGAYDVPNQLIFCVSKATLPTLITPLFFEK